MFHEINQDGEEAAGKSSGGEQPKGLRGRLFGGRGRGFSFFKKKQQPPPPDMGLKLPRVCDYNVEYWVSCTDGEFVSVDENFKRRHTAAPVEREETEAMRRRRLRCTVPEEGEEDVYRFDEDEEDTPPFGNGISTGINFDRYEDIEVRVIGDDVPNEIDSFENAGLRYHLSALIMKCNYTRPTPVQKYSIPIIMKGRDMMACAQTGSGKTAAYLIPMVNRLLEDHKALDSGVCMPQAIVVSPTRELTIQIYQEAKKFAYDTFLKVCVSYGGTSILHQIMNIMKGCHILVATPGRLLDFINRGKVVLSKVRFFVMDEADRMLDMGFLPDMEAILSHPTMSPQYERQTLMFSATFPDPIQRLATRFLRNYLFVTVGIVGGACEDVEQRFYEVNRFDKRNKLVDLLREFGPNNKCLVFVARKKATDFMATYLCEKDFRATSIHGDRHQYQREEALHDFRIGRMPILVATSVAARGLDIKDVVHVVNFDLPKTIEEYVHRIGRTGRVGNRGCATSFFDPRADRDLAPALVETLQKAHQPVPDFLRNPRESRNDPAFGPAPGSSRDKDDYDYYLHEPDPEEEAFDPLKHGEYVNEKW